MKDCKNIGDRKYNNGIKYFKDTKFIKDLMDIRYIRNIMDFKDNIVYIIDRVSKISR